MTPTQSLAVADRARQLSEIINSLVDEIEGQQHKQSQRFVLLGKALLEIEINSYWRNLGYASFNEYISSLRDRVDKGRSSLYGFVGVVRALLPVVGEESLEQMGYMKAAVLKSAMQISGRKPSENTVYQATRKSVSASKLREIVSTEMQVVFPPKDSRWFDFGGAMLTSDERKEIQAAMETAERTDPVISKELPDHERRKEVYLRWAREYQGTYAALVAEGRG